MNLCVYDTVKHVHVLDARLAVLRYFFLLAIAIYVGVFELWAFGGWLESSPVVGVVRFSLQQPTVNDCNPVLSNCTNDFRALDTLPYCSQFYNRTTIKNASQESFSSTNSDAYPGNVYDCQIYEAINAQIVSEKSIVVITRGSTTEQTLVCTDDMMTCPHTYQTTNNNNEQEDHNKFFTAQAESFTILLDHAVTASKLCTTHQKHEGYACSSEASQYQGRLYSKSSDLCLQHQDHAFAHYRGNERTTTAPCYIKPNQTSDTGQDFFSLDVLLKAAGIHLDDCNNNDDVSNDQESPCQTYRETGATLLLNIYWNDFVPYVGKVEPHYYYSPQFIAGSAFKQHIPFYHKYRESRTLLNAHGIKIAVLLGGEFNAFYIITFLTTVTTALGLLAVANTIVDNLMLYVLPEKDLYTKAKYETTEEIFHAGAGIVGTGTVPSITDARHTLSNVQQQEEDQPGQQQQPNPLDGNVHVQQPSDTVEDEATQPDDLREPLL